MWLYFVVTYNKSISPDDKFLKNIRKNLGIKRFDVIQKAILCQKTTRCCTKRTLLSSTSMLHRRVTDNGKNELMLHTNVFDVDKNKLICCTKKNYWTIYL